MAVARALATNPAIVIMDEPTGNLDKRNGDNILQMIRDLRQRDRDDVRHRHARHRTWREPPTGRSISSTAWWPTGDSSGDSNGKRMTIPPKGSV